MFASFKREAIMARKVRPLDERALVTDVGRACAMLGVCIDKLYILLRNGEIESYLEGRNRRIPVASIRAYVERKVAAAQVFERARHPHSGRALTS
jgi:excisionase family DNA binding protein